MSISEFPRALEALSCAGSSACAWRSSKLNRPTWKYITLWSCFVSFRKGENGDLFHGNNEIVALQCRLSTGIDGLGLDSFQVVGRK